MCFNLGESGKIREVGSKEEILQIYCHQLRLDSCTINIYTTNHCVSIVVTPTRYNLFYFILNLITVPKNAVEKGHSECSVLLLAGIGHIGVEAYSKMYTDKKKVGGLRRSDTKLSRVMNCIICLFCMFII
jgi:hypothetical protein